MAIKTNMDKAKQKAAEEAARAAQSNFGPMPFWKPKTGKNKVRIMPPWTEEGHNGYQWYRETWTHWNVGPEDEDRKTSVVCPIKTPPGEISACPLCAYVDQLRESGDPANMEEAKALKAKMRIYTNIIDLKDPTWSEDDIEQLLADGTPEDKCPEAGDPKIQVFAFGSMIFKDLLDYYTDDVDLVDLDEGYDVNITKEGKGVNTKYRVRTAPKPSKAPVPDDDPKVHNLDVLQPLKTPEQIEAIMEGVDPEEVKAMGAAAKEAAKELPAKEEKAKEEEEKPKEEKAKKKPAGKKPPGKKAKEEPFPPLDEDGYHDYDKVTDEQIEDPNNANVMDKHDNALHIGCYGGARQRDEEDSVCKDDCPLFERCGKRIEALDKPKKRKAPGKKKAGGKAKPEAETTGDDDEAAKLEAEMASHLES
jgi:hypothetical protein